jgi:hypothetical protein
MSDKLLEFENIMASSQKMYRSKLEKILEMRRMAEKNFLGERQKFSSVVQDLESAFLRKEENFQERLKRDYEIIERNYFELKNENCKHSTFLQDSNLL